MNIKNIIIIGAGNVATHLAIALQKADYNILQVFSRTEASASTLAIRLGCPYTTDIDKVSSEGQLYIVSVKDSALDSLLTPLTRRAPQALFVHTAGSVPMNIWQGQAQRYGVLYPMQTFSKQRPVDFHEVSFFTEANTQDDLKALNGIALSLGSKVYEASSEQRRYLHIAAVFACNFTNHMYAIADHLLSAHGLPFEAMLPLIDETARKVHELSPVSAQTGPAQRYDENVINRHLEMLQSEPRLATIYEQISKDIHEYTSNLKENL